MLEVIFLGGRYSLPPCLSLCPFRNIPVPAPFWQLPMGQVLQSLLLCLVGCCVVGDEGKDKVSTPPPEGSVVPSRVFPMLMGRLCSVAAQVLCVQAVVAWGVTGWCKACD